VFGRKDPFTLDPTGLWLLAANQKTGNIVVFKRDPTSGRLIPAGKTQELDSVVTLVLPKPPANSPPFVNGPHSCCSRVDEIPRWNRIRHAKGLRGPGDLRTGEAVWGGEELFDFGD
jgi:hypothetical protein